MEGQPPGWKIAEGRAKGAGEADMFRQVSHPSGASAEGSQGKRMLREEDEGRGERALQSAGELGHRNVSQGRGQSCHTFPSVS